MTTIEEKKRLTIEHALYFRKKLQTNDMNSEIVNLANFLKLNGLNKNGSMASATLSAEQTPSGYVVEIEVICPIDSKFQSNEKYQYVESVSIDNALYARYEGEPEFLQSAHTELASYVKQHNLTAATAMYNLVIKEPILNDPTCIMDIYIGIQAHF